MFTLCQSKLCLCIEKQFRERLCRCYFVGAREKKLSCICATVIMFHVYDQEGKIGQLILRRVVIVSQALALR